MSATDFLPRLAWASLLALPLLAIACGGSVIIDNPGDGGGGGTTTSSSGTTSTTGMITTGQGGTTQTGSTGQGGGIIDCEFGFTDCFNSYCADLSNDPFNCGSCGLVCADGAVCAFGNCQDPPPCVGCGEYITSGGNLCPGVSTDLYDSLANCVCADVCIGVCADNACAGQDITADCQTCVTDTVNGCGDLFNECANDI